MSPEQQLIDLAQRTWEGERVVDAYRQAGKLFELGDEMALVLGFGNTIAVRTGEGLVIIDTSSAAHAGPILDALREWDRSRVHTVIYTHGHFDHVGGMHLFDADAKERGYALPRVIAHENVIARFARYTDTAGYNRRINARQFRARTQQAEDDSPWQRWRQPDETYRDTRSLEIGGRTFELHHAKGETDDHTWVHIPDSAAVCSGDLFTWVCPNAGNPQKAQRYPAEWAAALRAIASLAPGALIPSHNLPVFGRERVATLIDDVATYLEQLVQDTVRLMNEGATLDRILQEVKPLPSLAAKHYLAPAYDEPEFIVRNVWRMYGGWYDGNPANLKPAPAAALARELAGLAGGVTRLADRARALAAAGELALACHLAEFAVQAGPEDAGAQRAREEIYRARAGRETSLMARSIFVGAAEESAHQPGQAGAG
ncbi:MAG: MBL fold metallo-hydrolase [Anaerolinea sp.]|nr:MBL fold metallo-hydrolase [Anaerolinea sp.]